MRNEIPKGTAIFEDVDELDYAFLKVIGCLATVVVSLIGVGIGIGYMIWG